MSTMTVRPFLQSLVTEHLRTKLMAWWLGKLDQDNRPTTFAQAELTLLQSAADGMTDLDDEAKVAALTTLAESDAFQQQASDLLDSVAYHAIDHVKALVQERRAQTIALWATRWTHLRSKMLYVTRTTDDWSKSVTTLQAVNAVRAEGVKDGCTPEELDAVSYGYGRLLLADLYDAEGQDDGANSDPAPRTLAGAHDAGTDDGRWMGVDRTKSEAESRFTEGTYDGGFTPGCGLMTAEELFDESVEQEAEVSRHRQMAYDAGMRQAWDDAKAHRASAWEIQTTGIVGRDK